MTTTIPNEEAAKRRLDTSLDKIRRAESFPTKDKKLSLGTKRRLWTIRVDRLEAHSKRQ
jgi:hypothetical protein